MSMRFRDPAGRDVEAATWFSPRGPLLVCLSDAVGYDLYSPEEWETSSPASFKADENGQVILHERLTGWTIPPDIRARAIH